MTRRTEVYPSSNNHYCLDTTAMVAAKVLSCDIEVIPAEEATSGKITVFLKSPPNEVQGVAFEFDTDIEATCFLKGLAKGVAVGLTQDVYTSAIEILEGVH